MWAVFLIFTLYQRCEVRAAQAKNFAKAYKLDNQLLLGYVM